MTNILQLSIKYGTSILLLAAAAWEHVIVYVNSYTVELKS